MKYIAMTAAALFLIAAPGSAFAQSDNSTGAETGGQNDATGSTTNAAGGDGQCSDQTATSGYASFSEKCRAQIDTWATAQSGKSAKFDGDIAVGTMLPESVEIIDVPTYKKYGYVMLNDRRVLVDRDTRKVVRVY
jgi:hypothetical protein